MTSEIVQYKADNGQEISISEQDVRDLLAAGGNKTDNVTPQEIKAFIRLCQSQRLNPFTKDAYIVKYGDAPAAIVVGIGAFVKRAKRNPKYQGHEAGISILGQDGKLHRREGSMLLQGERLVGGWCKVYIDGYVKPAFDEVSFSEYNAPDKYGKNGWSKIPATMIRKVALCHALREAFPEDLGGLYGAEEMDQAQNTMQEQQEAVIESVETIEQAEPPQQQASDPRAALWEEAAAVKQEAMALGAHEQGINDWMEANILNPDLTPKPKNAYTADDIAKLIDHLKRNIVDLQYLQQQNQPQPQEAHEAAEYAEYEELADNDIIF